MALPLETDEVELDVAPGSDRFTVALRVAATAAAPVTVVRVRLAAALGPWCRALDVYPFEVPRGEERELQFEARGDLPRAVSGELVLDLACGPFTAARSVRVSLYPRRTFDGVYGIDFGSSRIAAAYIDPRSGTDRPVMVQLENGREEQESAVVADFAAPVTRVRPAGPLTVLPERLGSGTEVFFRPRQALTRNRQRAVIAPGRTHTVAERQSAAWALAEFIRRAGRRDVPGLPARVCVPTPTTLTPAQVAGLYEPVPGYEWLVGAVNPARARGLALDEATAAAFTWLWENQAELTARAAGSDPLRLLVVDAGASGVESSLLELNLEAPEPGRLRVLPRQLSRDGFRWLAGDRVTALAFRQLRRLAAERIVGRQLPAGDDGDGVVPCRFAPMIGPEYVRRMANFTALWRAAERLKEQLASGRHTPTEVTVVPTPGSAPTTLALSLTIPSLDEAVAPDANRAAARVHHMLTRDETGALHAVDRILLTGAAAALPAFRAAVERVQRLHEEAHGVAPALDDWTDRGKQAVAKGAALAAYFFEFAPRADGGAGRLSVNLDNLRRGVPFALSYNSGGEKQTRLVGPGAVFPAEGPLRWTVVRQDRIAFFRSAGGAELRSGDANDLAQYLGLAGIPEGVSRVEVELHPDHALRVVVDGQGKWIAPDDLPSDPLDDPFTGDL